MQFHQNCLDQKEAELEDRELNVERRERLPPQERDYVAEVTRSCKRQVREQIMLEREITCLEDEAANCKRLRSERDAMRNELAREEHYTQHFARVCAQLRAQRDDARAQLATAQADIDDLREFKASTSFEAQCRLMCPRVSE
jgi:hypothetical protein